MPMIKFLFFLIFTIVFCFLTVQTTYAIEDPLENPNNFFGIHILFPSELDQAKDVVNSNGGDWGYVTIPIQIIDLDLEKWQAFMDEAKRKHIIPIIRLATQNDPRNTAVWRKPMSSDIVDFANFLDSLEWPTKNRYVILFNEVNRFDEWGGEYPNPSEYADIVSYAHEVFKKTNPNFYLILGGMDASAPNDFHKYINGFAFLEDLLKTTDIVNKIDGFSSHSYPNPAFSQPPIDFKRISVATYRFEYDLINKYSKKKIPAFITETGWSDKTIPPDIISEYYRTTFENIWGRDKDKIVAITPFLLAAGGEPFEQFSFFKNGKPSDFLKTVLSLTKSKGKPNLNLSRLVTAENPEPMITEKFEHVKKVQEKSFSPLVVMYFKTILGLN